MEEPKEEVTTGMETEPAVGAGEGCREMEVQAEPPPVESTGGIEVKEEHSVYPPKWKIYPDSNYGIRTKREPAVEEKVGSEGRMEKLRRYVEVNHTMQTTVYGVILVHRNGFPHVVVLQGDRGEVVLPGGKLEQKEDDPVAGLKRKLEKKLSIRMSSEYEIGELLGTFYRTGYHERIVCG